MMAALELCFSREEKEVKACIKIASSIFSKRKRHLAKEFKILDEGWEHSRKIHFTLGKSKTKGRPQGWGWGIVCPSFNAQCCLETYLEVPVVCPPISLSAEFNSEFYKRIPEAATWVKPSWLACIVTPAAPPHNS